MAIKQSAPEPVLPFATQRKFAAWLAKHHASSSGVWIKIAKAASGIPSIKYAEAVEAALCWGWIDSQSKGVDENWYVQRFTPRGKRSPWSKINCAKASALISAGKMRPAGLAEIERAKKDGRWARAYDSPARATGIVGRQISSTTWIQPVDMPFFTGYKQQQSPRHAHDASTTSSGCWRERKRCIPKTYSDNSRERLLEARKLL